jgi:hydroxypyruvate isomerase
MKTDRREFLLASGLALGSFALPHPAGAAANPGRSGDIPRTGFTRLDKIGVQLYSVRKAMQSGFDATLASIAAIGYQQVEFTGLFGQPAVEVRGTLDRLGLSAPSMHVPYEALDTGWSAALDDAHQLGCRYVVIPSIPGTQRNSLDDYRRVADRFNRAAEMAAKAGLRFAYHNHDVDFAPLEHRLPFDVLLESSDAALVGYELDLYWIVRSGQDPLRYFKRWPGRCKLVHVKDSMGGPAHHMTEVGSGIIEWPQLLSAARAGGVEYFIVEHDAAEDPLQSISTSFSYLRAIRLTEPAPHKGRLRQSIARWTLKAMPLPEICRRVKALGYDGVDLLFPDEWQVARDAGLVCSMGYASWRKGFIETGFNDPVHHAMLLAELEAAIPLAAQAGVPNLIAMFGNRHKSPEADDMAACVSGLSKIAPLAERHGVTICVELLNSRIDHPGYEGDHTAFGVGVIQAVGSRRVKLLYDIYHMQIMEGDVIRTIRNNLPWIAHFHTGGVPGRHEIDDSQELNYRAVAKAIADAGFPGYVAHEFLPVGDPFKSFAEAHRIFEV